MFNLQARKRVELGNDIMSPSDEEALPRAGLDMIMAKLANLLYDSRNIVRVGTHPFTFPSGGSNEPMPDSMNYELMLLRALEINSALDEWQEKLPFSWQPYRNTQPDSIHHSIRAVGLYNGLCDVYSSTSVSHEYNGWRSHKILVLRLIRHCLQHLPPSPAHSGFISVVETDEYIQAFVDDICASVPFHLGSRTSVMLPHEHAEYPNVPAALRESADYVDSTGQPATMTDQDHARAAAAIGGWFLLTPLVVVLRYCKPTQSQALMFSEPDAVGVPAVSDLEPVRLRRGQLEWIFGQVKRIHKVYMIPFCGDQPGDMGATESMAYDSPASDTEYHGLHLAR